MIDAVAVEEKLEESLKQSYSFGFPFQPYGIQEDLMKVAYQTYEDSKFALLESPTGTGKSLSLICSALSWLVDHRNRLRKDLEDEKNELTSTIEDLKREELNSTDWLGIQTRRQDLNRKLNEINCSLDKVTQLETRREARRHAQVHEAPLENYSSLIDKIKVKNHNGGSNLAQDILRSTKELDAILEDEPLDEESLEKKMKEDCEEFVIRPKVYYASRTHSQLGQFINEIKKTQYSKSDLPEKKISLTPLASRANLCVNPDVTKLKDPSAINEKCTEMQRETNKTKRCPYMKAKQINLLKEQILSSVQDIEDIVKKGKSLGSCPYYATRVAVPEAEVVVLPYNNLLHHETRKATSLDLKDSVVIVDEAHNIIETICSIHSASITGRDLISSHSILSKYYNKFQSRLSPRNSEVIKSIVLCLTALIKYLDSPEQHLSDFENPRAVKLDENGTPQKSTTGNTQGLSVVQQTGRTPKISSHESMMDVTKFIGVANIKPFNVFRIIDYFSRSQLARKLIGFFRQDCCIDISIELEVKGTHEIDPSDNANRPLEDPKLPATKKRKLQVKKSDNQKLKTEQTSLGFLMQTNPNLLKQAEDSSVAYPIYTLVEFLKSLTNLSESGKVLISHVESDILRSSLKFILLNPSSQFEQTSKEARSIVLAGGTMQPVDEFFNLLFEPLGILKERINVFSCGHVINENQLYIANLSSGCSGKPLELSYKSKFNNEFLNEIGATIRDIASVVPGGMICFFPSYEYEQICYDQWRSNSTISKIETKYKQLFREPRQASQSKEVLDKYSQAVEKWKSSNRGAILFCVVGGKMSEGINFNDDLGRCVVMVGLPYANIKSTELQQKMAYYDRVCSKQASTGQAVSAGQQYYENLCIKGINQSIGRAIRHRKDYAAVILLDRRYSTKTSIRSGLPSWMSKSLVDHNQFGFMLSQLKEFYKRMSMHDQ